MYCNIANLLPLLHIAINVLFSIYGIIFSKSVLDYVYIIFILSVLIGWTFYNGECIPTYYYKKQHDPEYKAGQDSTDVKDMRLFFGDYTFIINSCLVVIMVISEYIVLSRNNFPKYICYLLPISHLLYMICLRTFTKIYENGTFLFLQNIFKIEFILVLLAVIRRYIYKK
jgi:hypothetical protein